MRALVASPSAPMHLDLSDVADPDPKPHEAVVAVRATSFNRGEIKALESAEAGTVPGWDVTGVVDRQAADGTGPPEGTRVVGLAPGGAWGERVAVSTSLLAPIPDELDHERASTLPVAGLTARRALELGMVDGRRVAVTGATGGVGRFAVQLGAHDGGDVTAVVGPRGGGDDLLQLGAKHVVRGTVDPEGDPYDLILESVGGESLAAALGAVAPGGLVVSFGNSSGAPTTFPANAFYPKSGARLYAFVLFPELQRGGMASSDLRYLAGLMAGGVLDPGIDRVVPWNDVDGVRSAAQDLLGRNFRGKAVLSLQT